MGIRQLSQAEAAQLLGICERSFRRYIVKYEDEGLDGLLDRRLTQLSHRRAPIDEVLKITEHYRACHLGWNAKHYYSWYKRTGRQRSYTWVKNGLQSQGLIAKAKKREVHRKRRDRSAWPGLMIHQDASSHEWVPEQSWDLVVTMDDATNEHYSMFFVERKVRIVACKVCMR